MVQSLGIFVVSYRHKNLKSTLDWIRKRNFFDQVVVVADTKGGPELLEVAKTADKYVQMPINTGADGRPTAESLLSTDWTVFIDDDEVFSDSFFSGIRDAIDSNKYNGFQLPRMWLWPDKEHFIYSKPWYPDYQLRIWRKGTGKSSDTGVHSRYSITGTIGNIPFHLFHFDLINTTLQEREAKCEVQAHLMGVKDIKKEVGRFYLPEYEKDLLISPIIERINIL